MLVASATILSPDFSILIRRQNDEKLARRGEVTGAIQSWRA
jgi:hypothetical protein